MRSPCLLFFGILSEFNSPKYLVLYNKGIIGASLASREQVFVTVSEKSGLAILIPGKI